MSLADVPPASPSQRLRSPEQVELELPIAGPTSRMLAFAVDLTILSLVEVVVAIAVIYGMAQGSDVAAALGEWLDRLSASGIDLDVQAQDEHVSAALMITQGVFLIAQFVIEWGYFLCCEMLMNGRSPGKALLGLRVVRDSGLPIRFRESLLRNVLRLVDMLPLAYVVGLTSIIVSRDGKRLGDFAAGTVVVREDRPAAARSLGYETQAADEVFRFDRDQLAAVGAVEQRLIRQTLRRIDSLSLDRREEALERATEVLRERIQYLDDIGPRSRLAFLRALLRASEEP